MRKKAARSSGVMPGQDVCVIFNPHAGRRRWSGHLRRFRRLFGAGFTPLPTQRPGHAEELARAAARDGFRVVAAAGGDGTVHEVANGLLRSGNPDVALQVVPLGSANDYAHSLEHGTAADTALLRRVDVGRARGSGRERFFVNGLGLGFNGAVTLESRKIRYLRGQPLYSLALLRALCYRFVCPDLTLRLDEREQRVPTLALTVNLGRREGNFVMAPAARLDDGWFDYVHAGRLRRWELLRFLPAILAGGLPTDHPRIAIGRCRRVAVRADEPLTVHLDGEFFCQPRDGVHQLDVELLPLALTVCVPRLTAVGARQE
jgi:diacylglycerol kinase (ATP)